MIIDCRTEAKGLCSTETRRNFFRTLKMFIKYVPLEFLSVLIFPYLARIYEAHMF